MNSLVTDTNVLSSLLPAVQQGDLQSLETLASFASELMKHEEVLNTLDKQTLAMISQAAHRSSSCAGGRSHGRDSDAGPARPRAIDPATNVDPAATVSRAPRGGSSPARPQ